jgi:hypothetical protein
MLIANDQAIFYRHLITLNKNLKKIGLSFNDKKTKSFVYIKYKIKFQFLDFKIKHFDTKRHSTKNNQGHNLGFRFLIFPSKNSQTKHFAAVVIAY